MDHRIVSHDSKLFDAVTTVMISFQIVSGRRVILKPTLGSAENALLRYDQKFRVSCGGEGKEDVFCNK